MSAAVRRRSGPKCKHNPGADEIAAACLEIRNHWSKYEQWARGAWMFTRWWRRSYPSEVKDEKST